jgi:hypothetical protein
VFLGNFLEDIMSFNAGNNFLLARSPVAPNITSKLQFVFIIV